MRQIRGHLQLAMLFAVGLLAGVWTVVEPWVAGYPAASGGGWSASAWANVWIGAGLAGVSGVGLVVVMALAARAAVRISSVSIGDEAEAISPGSGEEA